VSADLKSKLHEAAHALYRSRFQEDNGVDMACLIDLNALISSIPDAPETHLNIVQPSEMTPEVLAQFCESAAKELSARIPELNIILGKIEAAQHISRALLDRQVEPSLPAKVEELAIALIKVRNEARSRGESGHEAVARFVLADRKALEEKLRELAAHIAEQDSQRRRDALDGQGTMEEAYGRIQELEKQLAQARRETANEVFDKCIEAASDRNCVDRVGGSTGNAYGTQILIVNYLKAIRARFGGEGKL
jgi:hypothetical protein